MFSLPGQEHLSAGFIAATFRLLVALVLGGALGWNRERVGKPAGLRTHMMVALGASLFVLLSVEVLMEYSHPVSDARLDPTRVLQGVVGGIGFLGAGSIIQSRGNVEGVTTAASVWMAGAIGAGCGLGYYTIAGVATAFALITLYAVAFLEPPLIAGAKRKKDKAAAPRQVGPRNHG